VPSRRERGAPFSLQRGAQVPQRREAEPGDALPASRPAAAALGLDYCWNCDARCGPESHWAGPLHAAGRVPEPCPKPAGVIRAHPPPALPGTGTAPSASGSRAWGAVPASRAQPESHAQHENGGEKVTITTSATTSPRGNDHLTPTLHTTGGREDGERSLVGLVNREPVLEYRG